VLVAITVKRETVITTPKAKGASEMITSEHRYVESPKRGLMSQLYSNCPTDLYVIIDVLIILRQDLCGSSFRFKESEWKISYRLYVRSVNSKHRMLTTVIVMHSSSYCKTSPSTRPTNYNGFTKPAPSARAILSIKCSGISRTQYATWLKGLAKPKRNAKSFAQ
jgi:hypothetical protein